MHLHGKSIIGSSPTSTEGNVFYGFNPAETQQLAPAFYEASGNDISRAFDLAGQAFERYRSKSPNEISLFLNCIADEIEALGDALLERAAGETGLPLPRLTSERGRTTAQLRMFADIVREGSWVEAAIDRADPNRKPLPKPDVRKMLMPIGPVVVFGASNFPLAYSVAGGDTASALAAGNPVIVKGHPAHPGTSEMAARAIVQAAKVTSMPDGVFALLQGPSNELGLKVVEHPAAAAVGFTGSLQGGRAIFDAASRRPKPIPVFAEMGSTNPVFVLPGALRERGQSFAEGLLQSVTLGVGQFCTCPGLVVGVQSEHMQSFSDNFQKLVTTAQPATMVHAGILRSYHTGLDYLAQLENVQRCSSGIVADENRTQAQPTVFMTDSNTFLEQESLSKEVFGPSTVVVRCHSGDELLQIARDLQGHLTATIHGTAEDFQEFGELVSILQTKVGRIVFNGFPTGVEVCAAMNHGGPYPATTDSHWTSVGAAAIKRFARPVCFQNSPQELLPLELHDDNPRQIWRTVDGQLMKG